MKRRPSPGSESASGPVRRGRQPQISCDSCRRKKLKCGPERPCPNCVTRNQPCEGGPPPPERLGVVHVDSLNNSKEILGRLRRLEQAVFDGPPRPSQPQILGSELQCSSTQTASLLAALDYPAAPDTQLPADKCPFNFRVAEPASASTSAFGLQQNSDAPSRTVILPAREDALLLFDYFLETAHFLPHIIHAPTTRSVISDVCSPNDDYSGRTAPRTAQAAIALSILATAAFFWEKHASHDICRLFPSEQDALLPGRTWLRSGWDLLDRLRQTALSVSLEEVQANVVLSDLIYNTEGCSSRFRFLHGRSLALARELSLQAVDLRPPSSALTKVEEQHKEIRRRVWWYIASSDWLLSVMGGPLDRTYVVNPQHMMVNFPANSNNDDPSLAQPAGAATEMTYFILRTRLAEVCRKVSDCFPFGSHEITELPYDRVAAISRLFDEAYAGMPPCRLLGSPTPSHLPPTASTERRVIQLGFHARRARIFRPFLHSAPKHQTDPRFSQFRALCLHSARVVLEIASDLVREGLDAGKARTKWSGCVISHLFIACVVLVTHPALESEGALSNRPHDPEAEDIRSELNDARRLLERAAEVSSVAGNLVRKLVEVLKRYRVLSVAPAEVSVGEKGADITTPASTTGSYYISETTATVVGDSIDTTWLLPRALESRGHDQSQRIEKLQWTDLVGDDLPDGDGWGQLFADLDAAFPAPFFS
ncbi:hypothetical protein QBC34DRAFT_479943 [Podospora aff. communis PSN243]|uniref:Zn(2)-C6 fungal-type domain-containing protein n=1 Tax=Podospora aff. communis PSN243 TaxID=3040156 RepID=A0AAV9G3N4_9PEZI|nr:hypothetical protein QBC34DRAFT_479943 [Podospora aff. communis PSN243]